MAVDVRREGDRRCSNRSRIGSGSARAAWSSGPRRSPPRPSAGWWAFADAAAPAGRGGPARGSTPSAPSVDRGPADRRRAGATIVVHVDGAVVRPGVHELAAGARVIDAVDAAAGLLADADRERLNLAAPVARRPTGVGPVGGRGDALGRGAVGRRNRRRRRRPPMGWSTSTRPISGSSRRCRESGPSIAAAILRHRERGGPVRAGRGSPRGAGNRSDPARPTRSRWWSCEGPRGPWRRRSPAHGSLPGCRGGRRPSSPGRRP